MAAMAVTNFIDFRADASLATSVAESLAKGNIVAFRNYGAFPLILDNAPLRPLTERAVVYIDYTRDRTTNIDQVRSEIRAQIPTAQEVADPNRTLITTYSVGCPMVLSTRVSSCNPCQRCSIL